jgi:ectoine hydroxylase-related dioxygenase (phytanoyl-CoA dioxygenase family)
MKRARTQFRKNQDIASVYRRALIAAGADPKTTFIDKLSLRGAPPFDTPYAPGFGALPPHRDSWGAGLDCQINWWLPFYEITPERTMAIFPRYWHQPIANDSEGWDWRRAMKEPGYPRLPAAQEPVDWSEAFYVVVAPGSLVAFSASHLHASVPNTTGQARISSDTRTVDLAHLRHGIGAPNVDRAAGTPNLDWFHHIETGQPLSEAI